MKFRKTYIKHLRINGSIRLSKQRNVILNKIKSFTNSEVIEFGDFTKEFINEIQKYFQVEYKNHQNKIRKDHERLKRVLDDAEQKELLSENPFDKYTLSARQKTKKEALTFQQIKDIKRLKLESGSDLYLVRNYFMFSFYNAGIRFGDLCRMKQSNIQIGLLKYEMSKCMKDLNPKWKNVKLNDRSFEIFKDYHPSGSDSNFIFPILDAIKELAGPSGFDSDKGSKNADINIS